MGLFTKVILAFVDHLTGIPLTAEALHGLTFHAQTQARTYLNLVACRV